MLKNHVGCSIIVYIIIEECVFMTDSRSKIAASVITLCITGICTAAAFLIPIETTAMKIAGSFASVIAISAAAWKFPKRFYFLAMIFDVFAASLGSVINLYKTVGFYDRFVHYLSGVLLAEAGMIIIDHLFRSRNIKDDIFIKLSFAFFFSCACAGFWEIYEFTADILINADMQGGNTNTMGDIVSGVLGALTYFIVYYFINRSKKR